MPNRKISQLPSTATTITPELQDTDQVPLARGGSTYHILGSNVRTPILNTAQSTMLTKVNSLSARNTDTIDLSFSSASYALSANVRDGSITTSKIASEAIRYSNLASWQSLSASPTLSAEAVQPRLAKAWVNFDGTFATSPFIIGNGIRDAFNISSIIDDGVGNYRVNFTSNMTQTNYTIVASTHGEYGTNNGMCVQINCNNIASVFSEYTPQLSGFKIVTSTSSGAAVAKDMKYINVVVFAY